MLGVKTTAHVFLGVITSKLSEIGAIGVWGLGDLVFAWCLLNPKP